MLEIMTLQANSSKMGKIDNHFFFLKLISLQIDIKDKIYENFVCN